ncbi:MAG: hypothetical protein IT553_06445 [Sphingomonadaceae bacterium]|nr:hypothetical protein [Sphingomonadaceae bacterium]
MELLTIFYAVLAATLGLSGGADRASLRPVAVASAPSAAVAVAPKIAETAVRTPRIAAALQPMLHLSHPNFALAAAPVAPAVRTIFARRHE